MVDWLQTGLFTTAAKRRDACFGSDPESQSPGKCDESPNIDTATVLAAATVLKVQEY
jgi:hypothetical protein